MAETLLSKLTDIISYTLFAFGLALLVYPSYIKFLQKIKANKTLREDAASGGKAVIFNKLHAHKAGTPTMGGGMFLFIAALLIAISYLLQHLHYISNSLLTRQETYIILFAFFGMGIWGLIDDRLNVKGKGSAKGFSAKAKLIGMIALAARVSYWFFAKLGVDYLHLWPVSTSILHIGIRYPILTFFFTIAIVNAINITDGLDGLAGGMMVIVLIVMAIITFTYGRYLATAVVGIVIGVLLAFLMFNVPPAKIFMGDSGALALGGLVATLVYLINLRNNFILPFMILFLLFWLELLSSFLQMFWKKVFKKKLFVIAPFHHLLENKGMHEYSITMKFWILQGILAAVTLILMFYQSN